MARVVPTQVIQLIDRLFPFAAQPGPQPEVAVGLNFLTQLAAVVRLVDQVPQELITLDADDYSAFVWSIEAIRAAIPLWQARGAAYNLSTLRAFDNLSPVTVLRRALALCHDQFPSPETSELNFIQDLEFRQSLRIDISSTNRALSNSEWKAATVLAGSVVEALLLWALQQRQADIPTAIAALSQKGAPIADAGKSLEFWHLPSYIEVAAELKVIKADTATQARLAKDYRNLIHPGRAARLGQACNRGTALSAVAAVELVVGDLAPKTP